MTECQEKEPQVQNSWEPIWSPGIDGQLRERTIDVVARLVVDDEGMQIRGSKGRDLIAKKAEVAVIETSK